MTYYQLAPPVTLARYVRFFWVLESDIQPGQTYVHRSLADGSAELIFHYKGVFRTLTGPSCSSGFRSGIDGQSRVYRRYEAAENFGIFGAYLFPYAVPALFGHSADAVSNEMPDLSTLIGQDGRDLEEQIMLASDNHERTVILTAFLQRRMQKKEVALPAIFSSITHIIKARGMVDIQTMAGNAFLSSRQFERKFKEYAGFSPKLYSRIIRFQAAIACYGNRNRTLTEIAYECGYYDQSHFIHDFKEFSGYHPRHYFKGDNESTYWKRQ